MVNFTVEEIRKIMDNPDNIRNMSIIAQVDHGKSTLFDLFERKVGINFIKYKRYPRYTDTCEDEIERVPITVKSTNVPLYYKYFGEALNNT